MREVKIYYFRDLLYDPGRYTGVLPIVTSIRVTLNWAIATFGSIIPTYFLTLTGTRKHHEIITHT